jgi:hypothetical protein
MGLNVSFYDASHISYVAIKSMQSQEPSHQTEYRQALSLDPPADFALLVLVGEGFESVFICR